MPSPSRPRERASAGGGGGARPHRHHKVAAEWADRRVGDVGREHGHVATLLDVPWRKARLLQLPLRGRAIQWQLCAGRLVCVAPVPPTRVGRPAAYEAPHAPSRRSLTSQEKEHPRRKPTMPSSQSELTSSTSAASAPSRHTRYLGKSVRTSAPGAAVRGQGSPGAVTSSSGQARGLERAKRRKSKACAEGSATKFACTKPGARPGVGVESRPVRHSVRTA